MNYDFVFISDDHWSQNDKYGLNAVKSDALKFVFDLYVRRSRYFVHVGDIAEKRQYNIDLISEITGVYREFCFKDVGYFWLTGNHCSSNRAISPLTPFVDGLIAGGIKARVIGKESYEIENLVFRGWDSNSSLPESKADVLVTHCRVEEWSGSGEKSYTVKELNESIFKRIIAGDTHLPVESGKTVSIGTFSASNFKDRDIESGFILFNSETLEYKRIKIPNYPIFRKLVVTPETVEPDASWVKGNIVRVEFKGPQKWITNDLKRRWQLAIWAREPRSFEFGEDYYIGETRTQQAISGLSVEQRYKATAKTLGWDEPSAEIGRKALA